MVPGQRADTHVSGILDKYNIVLGTYLGRLCNFNCTLLCNLLFYLAMPTIR